MAIMPKRLSAAFKSADIVYALYPYACSSTDQSSELVFPQGAVLLVAERADDGWCRGYSSGVQGWFPASYIQSIPMEQLLKVHLIIEIYGMVLAILIMLYVVVYQV